MDPRKLLFARQIAPCVRIARRARAAGRLQRAATMSHDEKDMIRLAAGAVLFVLVVGATAMTGGCTTTIYKSTAGDYVDAAKQITTALQNAEVSRSSAQAQAKVDLIVEDQSCPIQRPGGVYLRPSALGMTDVHFADWIKGAGLESGANASACRKLASCDAHGACSGTCFDAEESACIDQVGHYYSISTQPGDKAIASEVTTDIAELSYPMKSSGNTYLATSLVQTLSAYLDLLGKAADGKAADEFKSDATQLANGVKSVTDTYKSAVGKNLVAPATATEAESSINALGAVIQDIATAVQNSKDTAAVKAAVEKDDKQINDIMAEMERFVVADIQLAGAQVGNSNAEHLQELQSVFAKSGVLQRRVIMGKAQLLYANGGVTAMVRATQAVFKKAQDAHDTLIQLVRDPTNQQLQQIRAQEFASFRSTAADLGSLIALFIK